MSELFKLGISEFTFNEMICVNSNIVNISSEEVIIKIDILKDIGCSDNQIINIISSNAMYLDRTNEEIIKLLYYLKKLGFSALSILIDSNPFILNLDIFEINRYIKNRLKNNELLEEIVDDLDSNPYLFNEM